MNYTPDQITVMGNFAQKLYGLGIRNTKFHKVEIGPVVTGYYLKLSFDTPIAKIIKKSEDFALAAGVESVEINRIGGDIVIFVPNKERKLIDFKDALHWLMTDKSVEQMKIPVILGQNYLGEKAALDLTEQPHILIAGATGSGKSVLEAAILCSLGVRMKPSDLYMYLVDTKQLDLPLFTQLPHVKKVVTNLDDFHKMMDELMIITRTRMEVLRNSSCRNIDEYKQMGLQMPYILIMIDELADLIDQDTLKRKSADKDNPYDFPPIPLRLKHLVQICRAAGIHIITCTQRSSVKIVSNDIKANLPCRISLRLSTDADSRTILGVGGAQYLLGKGDMLIQRPEKDALERYHGPYVSMNDITEIVFSHERMREVFEMMRG